MPLQNYHFRWCWKSERPTPVLLASGGVGIERLTTNTCVIASGGVGERLKTNTCVIASGGVFLERVMTNTCVLASGGVGIERA